jgi:hypothetical protein
MTYYQIKSSRITMGGRVGKRYLSAKLAATRQSIQWQNEYPDRSGTLQRLQGGAEWGATVRELLHTEMNKPKVMMLAITPLSHQ